MSARDNEAAAPGSARRRLGQALAARREQIHPRYANRSAFIRERGRGLSAASFSDIETRARTSFEPATITALESIYELPPGWLSAALNGDIRPLLPPGVATPAAVVAVLAALTDPGLPEGYLDEIERHAAAAGAPPGRLRAVRQALRAVRQARREHGALAPGEARSAV